jgi:hypothetical protein
MSVILALLFFALKIAAVVAGHKNKGYLVTLTLALASFCLTHFKNSDSLALQRIWKTSEKHWK